MLDQSYLDAIKKFEGFSAEARWDYAQNSNGYGTRARYAGEVIDKAEADRRFAGEIEKAADFVDRFAPGLDDGSRAALTSLTYNAGTAWSQSGLGEAVSNGDMNKARSLFLQYHKAGGEAVDGLVQRRLQEVAWFGSGALAAQSQSQSTSVVAMAQQPISAPPTEIESPVAPQTAASHPRSVVRLADSSSEPRSSPDRAFADLGSDPALLALLAHIGKSQPTREADDQRAEPRTEPQAV
jgi:lysozyme